MSLAYAHFVWRMGSGTDTGASTTVFDNMGLRACRNLSLYLASDTASTMSIGIEVGVDSTSPWVRMGSTAYTLGAGDAVVVQFSGPVEAIRPYLITRTNSAAIATIRLTGN